MFSDPKKNLEQFDISPGQKVADFGSGAGFYTFPSAQAVGQDGKVYAIDVQKSLLVTLKHEADKGHLFNIEIVWADVEKPNGIKLRNDLIDRGIVANVLFQTPQKEVFVKEIRRVLKPGGKVLVIDWTDSFGGLGPTQDKILNSQACRELFEKNGFAFEKNVSAGAHHYGFVFGKA